MRRVARRVARRIGVECALLAAWCRRLPRHVRSDMRDHERLVALLEEMLEPDADCLDIGAHEGAVLKEIVRVAPDGRHVAWEPLPAFARGLRGRFPMVEIREAALSDAPGDRSFAHILDDPGWSGFRARPTPQAGSVETIRVRCERLDDALPAGVRPGLVKIDVEGAEEQVLLGASETLRRFRPVIVFEHGCGSADYYGTTPGRIHELFTRSLGYEIYGLDWDGPYTAARFTEIFARGERVNFVAVPRADSRYRAPCSRSTSAKRA
jgi:FkbM family methyltransferase